MGVQFEEILTYSLVAIFCGLIVYLYLRKHKKHSQVVRDKVEKAKVEGLFEPVSLHPYIDLSTCIGSGACVAACPEKDILGLINGKATVVMASNCVGHGACFHACPVEAISLRIGTEKRGVDLPHVNENFESNMPGIYIAGELGGMGLIKNSVEQGQQAVENIHKKMKYTPDNKHDLVVVGAGPAGISATLTAKNLGMDCLTLEQDTLGGTVFTFPRSKVVMTSPMHLPGYGKVKLFDTSKEELLDLWHEALDNNEVKIKEKTKVERIVPLEDHTFRVETANGESLLTHNVLIAIGRRGTPRKLNVPGEQSTKVAYRMLEPERISDKKILVVGGGDSAVESAMLVMENNDVILSYRKDKFARIKPKNREDIQAAEASGKLRILYNTNVKSIHDDHVLIEVKPTGEILKETNDLVYIFAGGELPTKFLENAGIKVTKRFGYIMKKYR